MASFSSRWLLLLAATLLSLGGALAIDTYAELLTGWDNQVFALTWTNPTPFTKGVKYEVSSHKREQRWKLTDQKQIQSLEGWCLSTSDNLGESGRPILVVVDCAGGTSQQAEQKQWTYIPQSKAIVNVHYNDQCLDASRESSDVQTWDCNPLFPGVSQQWRIQYPGYYVQFISFSASSSRCLTTDTDQADGTLWLAECEDKLLQYWKYDFFHGELRIGKDGGSICLDTPGAGEGKPPHTWSCDASNANQHIDFELNAGDANTVYGKFRIRDTNWCLTSTDNTWISIVKCNALPEWTWWVIGTGKPANVASCADKQCQNDGVCVDGACRCPVGASGASCETKAKYIGYETSHGYFLTVGQTNYDLLFSKADPLNVQQTFVYNAKTKQLVVKDRFMCLEAVAPSVKLADCDISNGMQRWWYNAVDGLMHVDNQNLCLSVDFDNEASGRVSIGACVTTGKQRQVWFETEDVSLTVFSPIRNRDQISKCWTASPSGSGIVIQDCKASVAAQLWKFDPTSFLIRKSSNECLFTTSQTGATASLSSCGAEQSDIKFEYDPPSGLIRKKDSNLCASLSAQNTIAFVACDSSSLAQQWIIPVDDNCKDPKFLKSMDNCNNRGTCSYRGCQCDAGWTNQKCQTDSCDSVTCNNGGKCDKGKCQCRDGYVGLFCGVFVKCQDVKCLHGGACAEDGLCQCPVGFSGARCQIKHAKVLLRTLDNQAIAMASGHIEVVMPNMREKDHVWIYDDAKNMFRSHGSPAYCLERVAVGSEFKAGQCSATKSEQKWKYNAKAGTLSALDNSGTLGIERTMSGRFAVVAVTADGQVESTGSDSASARSSAVENAFVEVDRLDLDGSAIRNHDKTKCLHYTSDSKIVFADCSEKEELQQWEYHPQNGVIRLPKIGAPRCLAQNGATIKGVACDGSKEEQQFRYDWTSRRFRNRKTLDCLDTSSGALGAAACGDSASPGQVLHAYFRSFCDVVSLCGAGHCEFEQCVCPAGQSGAFCEA